MPAVFVKGYLENAENSKKQKTTTTQFSKDALNWQYLFKSDSKYL